MDTSNKSIGAEVLNNLPDEALVRGRVALAAWGGISRVTYWRYCKAGVVPMPLKIGRSNFWRVGDLRRALNSLVTA